MSVSGESVPSQDPVRGNGKAEKSLARAATWLVWFAAALLTMISAGGYLYHRGQLSAIASEHLRLVVTGPACLQAGLSAEYTISTTAISGHALSVHVEATLVAPDGTRLTAHRETTDEQGRLRVTIPADLPLPSRATLKVVALHDDSREEVELPLTVQPVRFTICLSTDKALYQPGETLYYRSLTLTHLNAAPEQEATVQFALLDPDGVAVPGSRQEVVSRRGVAEGAFPIPKSLAAGQFTLLVRSPSQAFPEQRRSIDIRTYRLPRWEKALAFTRDGYAPGDKVTAGFHARRLNGAATPNAKLHVVATTDGRAIFEKNMVFGNTAPDGIGDVQIDFGLPQKIESCEGQLMATLADGDVMETQTKAISILRGAVDVAFFPESGELVAGVETRVYFAARDEQGRPVSLSGVIVAGRAEKDRAQKDTENQPDREADVATVETSHHGLGVFSLVPAMSETYRLKITRPAGLLCASKLPEVSADRDVVLSTGAGVFAAGAPLEFNLRASKAGLPLIAAAYCRGAQVGEQPLVTQFGPTGANPVRIPLDDSVGGVIRLAAYDYSVSPPRAVAERLVYRRPARRLNVQINGAEAVCSPGKPVELSVLVTNEKGEPTPAMLGIAVIDEATCSLAGTRAPSLSAQCLLAGEIRSPFRSRPEDLEDADFYLADDAKDGGAVAATLDLLLGVQGRHRSANRLAGATAEGGTPSDGQRGVNALDGEAQPPAIVDNIEKIRDNYDLSLAEFLADRTRALNTLVTVAFFGGLGLIVLLTMLGLMRIAWGMHLWIPTVAATASCLVIGAILLAGSRQPNSLDATTAFRSYPAASADEQPPTPDPTQGSPTAQPAANPPAANRPAPNPQAVVGQYIHQHSSSPSAAQKDFAETLYWNPMLLTGSDGKASIRFDLSNSATTFRVLVDAHGEGRIGFGQAALVSREPAEPSQEPSEDVDRTSAAPPANTQSTDATP